MAVVHRTIPRSCREVYEALITPETYPHWLVGAREIRSVDEGWPAKGTAFHHRVGLVGPLKVADSTKVLDVEEPTLLDLEVRARPFGRGRATFTLREEPGSAGPQTVIELAEVPLGLLAPTQPIVDPITARRNRRSLAQLEDFLLTGASHRAPG
jgi:uncharacterized protein YndB with AHSA1/START domain